eukprot:Selendium_serpulae@DN4459_c0_g1_i1.p2
MSKKFHDRLLQGSGVSGTKFHSSFGAKLLAKFGWEEGKGLGKDEDGKQDPIQIKKRDETVGLGAETNKHKTAYNEWWDDMYNSVAESLKTTEPGSADSSDEDESPEDSTNDILDLCEGRSC